MQKIITLKKDLPGIPKGTVGVWSDSDETWIFTHKDKTINHTQTFSVPSLFPEWFDIKDVYTSEDVKEGSYWRCGASLCRIMNKNLAYNITNNFQWGFQINEEYSPATTEEIELALIKEAERRGYKFGQLVNKPSFGKERLNIKKKEPWGDICETWEYNSNEDRLLLYGNEIYSKGIWAEIIDETKKEGPTPSMELSYKDLWGRYMEGKSKMGSALQKIENKLRKEGKLQ